MDHAVHACINENPDNSRRVAQRDVHFAHIFEKSNELIEGKFYDWSDEKIAPETSLRYMICQNAYDNSVQISCSNFVYFYTTRPCHTAD